MDNKKILKNIGISMLMKPIGMILTFVYIPLVLAYLGDEKYGVWAIVLNVVSWINYFDIGIGNGLRNKLAEAIAQDNEIDAQCYVSTAYFISTIIATLFCIIITTIWNLFDLSTFFQLNVAENVNTVVFISVLFICINFVIGLSKTSAYALQQPGYISVLGGLVQIMHIITVIIISNILSGDLIVIAISYGFVSMFDGIVLNIILTHKHKYLIPKLSSIRLGYASDLVKLGVGFFAMQICTLVLNTTDNLIISNQFGSAEVTPYNMVYKCFYMIVQIHAIVIMPMWSAYTAASAISDISWIKSTMRKVNLVTVLLAIGCLVGIFAFEPLAALWLGRRLVYGKSLIIITSLYMIIQMFANNYSAFLCGVGKIKVATGLSVIGAILNIPLSVYFANNLNMRLSGVVLGSMVVMMLSFIVLPIVTHFVIRDMEGNNGQD